MLDIKFIRENPDIVKDSIKKRGLKVDLDQLLKIDEKKRKIQTELEGISAQKNKVSKQISKSVDRKKIISQIQKIDRKGDELKQNLKKIEKEYNDLMYQIPNIPLDDVPVGKDEAKNVVIKRVGRVPKFSFKPQNYMEIAQNLDLIDIKRAAKVSGTRFSYIKKELVLLHFALVNFALDILVKEGFIPVLPPKMITAKMAWGMGYLEQSEDKEAYFLPKDNLYLIGTSEQSMGAMHSDEVLQEKDLPKRYVAFTTCFRREAGSYGKDTGGIFRAHEFDKVEMFSLSTPENSKKEHEYFLSLEERLMESLKLPYHVVNICTGDLGVPVAKKYDIEVWFPGQNNYRETHSTSNCTDFQTRRLNVRYRDRSGKIKFIHYINGTALSMRPMIAIMENYQQEDGSVKIPEVLQKYTGFKEIKNKP